MTTQTTLPLGSSRARVDTDLVRFTKGTWVVSSLFAGLSAAVAFAMVASSPPGTWIALPAGIVAAILVMPPLWWLLVERRASPHLGFAAIAGALGSVLVLSIQLIVWSIMYSVARGQQVVGGFILLVTLTGVPVAGVFGVLLGVAAAFVQRRLQAKPVAGAPPNGHSSARSRPEPSGVFALLRGTWLATLIFSVPHLWFAIHGTADAPILIGRLFFLPVLTPALWWTLVARHRPLNIGRGVVAGMAIAALHYTILSIVELASAEPGDDSSDPLAAIGFMLVLAVPFGAAFGALTAWVQKTVPGLVMPAAATKA